MHEHRLKRQLGLLHAVMIGVGASIGAGVFVLLGPATAIAGPSVVLGLLLSGIVNLFTIFSFCELGAALPEVGGEHVYVKTAFGGLLGFITGWFEWLSEMFYAVIMAMGAAIMLSFYLPIGDYVYFVAALLIIIFTLVNLKGTREAGTTAVVLGLTLLLVLGVYVVSGWLQGFRPNAFTPFMPNGIFATMTATAFLFVVYLGAEDIVIAQGEVKEPRKTIPRAIIINSIILIFVYTIIAYTTVGLVPPEELGASSAPLALAAEKTILGPVGVFMITIAGLIAALSSLNTAIMAQSRVIYSMGWEGYFPRFLAKVHRGYGTPYMAVLLASVFTIAFTVMGALEFATYASSFGFLIGYFLTNLALMKLRETKPHLERPFKAPFYPLTPIVSIAATFMLIAFIQPIVLALGGGFIVLAVLVYSVSMLGYQRIRIALGGISLGVGVSALVSTHLFNIGTLTSILPYPELLAFLPYGFVVFGVILVSVGALNIART